MRTFACLCLTFSALLAPSVQARPEAAGCGDGANDHWILVHVRGIRSAEGRIRVQLYDDKPADFLAKGKKLLRIEVPSRAGGTDICVPLPGPGRFSLVAMHDRNANGKADFFTEGFGFSNNPRLGLSAPDLAETLFEAQVGGMEMKIFLTYALFGRLAPDDPRSRPAATPSGPRRPTGAHVSDSVTED